LLDIWVFLLGELLDVLFSDDGHGHRYGVLVENGDLNH
jgi:hypothetical protein